MASTLGDKQKRITFEQLVPGLNAARQPTNTWATVVTLWADFRTLAGHELLTAQQVRPETTSRIFIHGREATISAEMRADFNGRKLQILAVYDPQEQGIETWMDCAEWKEPV